MNDRYLYRAKRCDNGEWIVGFYHWTNWRNPQTKEIVEVTHSILPIDYQDSYHVDSSTICQCTGLKDKNGKLIWENDVIRFQFDNDDCPFPNKDTKKRIGKVFFSDFRASWSITMGRNGSKSLNDDLWKYVQKGNRVEVIGSAIDNPELLEAGL